MRQRFVAPPTWQPEIKVERRIIEREATHASVLVPLVLRDEMTVLLTQRTDHLNDHPGQISFPGGRAEGSDADATATALREAHEEIGLEPFEIEVLGSLPTYTTSTGFIVTPVVGLVQPGASLRPDPFEVAEVFEVPLAWLMNPANHQRHAFEFAGATREFFSIPWQGSDANGVPSGLFSSPAAAALPRETVLIDPSGAWPVSWSPDGASLLIVTNSPKTGNDIWTLSLGGDRTPKAYQRTEASENWAAFSPDGRWVAFSSTAGSDVPEVYVTRFPTPSQAWRVSADGGTQARWRRDGKEIFYVAPDRQLMAAAVTLGQDSVKIDRIEALFGLRFPYGAYHAFDVTQDGQRFLVNTSLTSSGAPQQVRR